MHLGLVVFGEVGVTHPTRDAQRASRTLTSGALRSWFRGALAAGLAAAALALATPWLGAVSLVAAALAALAALWLWEHGWLRAGQSVPLS